MAYTQINSRGQKYYLHAKEVTLKGGRPQRIFYFAQDARVNAIEAIPEGFEVTENNHTGLLVLRKEKIDI